MAVKSIEAIISPPHHHYVGDGFRVHNFIPGSYGMDRMNPFIMLDYNSKFYFEPSEKPRGVDVHPHRGFETVTIAYQGKVAHHDSTGNSGIISEGDVQWMTAASGILHKEYHEEQFSRSGGFFQMVQLWVNLLAKDKMSPPKYQSITNDEIHKYTLPSGNGVIEVIAGEHKGITGTASTFSPLHLLNVKLDKEAKETFTFPAAYNTALLVIEGNVKVNGSYIIPTDHFCLFRNDGDTFELESIDKSTVLILSGASIHEPIAAHGPFVMNSRQEIMEAMEDYNAGKFGTLDE